MKSFRCSDKWGSCTSSSVFEFISLSADRRFRKLGQSAEAILCYQTQTRLVGTLTIPPDNPQLAELFHRLGILLEQSKRSNEAIECHRRELELGRGRPHDEAVALCNLGNAMESAGQVRLVVVQ